MEDSFRKKAYVNGTLIVLNVIYFLYLEIVGSTEDTAFMYQHGAALAPSIILGKEYYRLFTSIFMHFGINHIANNMLVLFVTGDNLERALGHVKYLILYLACGVGSNICSTYLRGPYSFDVSAGASGAIFGVIGGLLFAVLANRGRLEDLSTRQMLVMIVFSLYFGLTSTGIDNVAHISGLILGFLFCALLYRKPRRKNIYGGEQDER